MATHGGRGAERTVALSDEGLVAPGHHVDLLSIIADGAAVDIEAHEDLRGGGVETEDDLDVSVGELRHDGDGVSGAEGQDVVGDLVADGLVDLLELVPRQWQRGRGRTCPPPHPDRR